MSLCARCSLDAVGPPIRSNTPAEFKYAFETDGDIDDMYDGGSVPPYGGQTDSWQFLVPSITVGKTVYKASLPGRMVVYRPWRGVPLEWTATVNVYDIDDDSIRDYFKETLDKSSNAQLKTRLAEFVERMGETTDNAEAFLSNESPTAEQRERAIADLVSRTGDYFSDTNYESAVVYYVRIRNTGNIPRGSYPADYVKNVRSMGAMYTLDEVQRLAYQTMRMAKEMVNMDPRL